MRDTPGRPPESKAIGRGKPDRGWHGPAHSSRAARGSRTRKRHPPPGPESQGKFKVGEDASTRGLVCQANHTRPVLRLRTRVPDRITLRPAAKAGHTAGIGLAWFHPLGADNTRRIPMPETSPRLPFEIDEAIDPSLVTGRAGVPLVIEVFRQLGVAAAIDAHVAVKQRQRGLPPVAVRREPDRPVDKRRGPLPGPRHAPRGSRLGDAARLPVAGGDHGARLPGRLPRRGRAALGGRAPDGDPSVIEDAASYVSWRSRPRSRCQVGACPPLQGRHPPASK